MKKIGVVLGGCGVYDGSEIHEAVITLLAIARNGAQAVCFAAIASRVITASWISLPSYTPQPPSTTPIFFIAFAPPCNSLKPVKNVD